MVRQTLPRRGRHDSGQALTEYAVLIAVTVTALLGIPDLVLSALSEYYTEITSLLCLPVP
jgi:Flp pilus assembly pilin Flp